MTRPPVAPVILGLGGDLVDIRRIADSLARFGDRFVERCFTAAEQARCDSRADRAGGYARRFAAKEACAKALGTGIAEGIYWRDIEVGNDALGRPTLTLTGGAHARLGALTPAGLVPRIHLSLADEPPIAQAIVILSAVAPDADAVTAA